MRKFLQKFWPLVILVILSIFFFAKLFIPSSKIFVTPEFGMSDLWHQNLPYRFLLKEALSEGHLPLWTDKIGMGFPLFAEGQVAALSLVNLIPTLFFSAVTSFNLSFILIFLILSIGTFFFCREIGVSKQGSLLSAIALTFSAKVVTQLNHPNILLTFAFLPLSLFLVEKYHQEKKAIWLLFLSFILSQQVLSGHLQMAFYSWVLVGVFWVFSLKSLEKPKRLIPLGMAMLLALGISAIQLLPSWEFMHDSNRAVGLTEDIDAFPFRLRHLGLFLRPNFFGTPADATYPLDASKEGLFWENSVYIGIIPLVLGVLGIIGGFREIRERKGKKIMFWGVVAVFSLVLALGRATPLFFVFKLPLMNFFRIPPRFLFFTVLALAILAGYGFDIVMTAIRNPKLLRIFVLCSLFFVFLDLSSFGYNYQETASAKDWIEAPPATAQFLQKDEQEFRIVDAGSDSFWNQIFWRTGWLEQNERYKNLRNSLFTNSGVYYDIKSAGVYAGVQLQRIDEIFKIFKGKLSVTPEGKIVVSKELAKLLGAFSVKYFVTPIALETKGLNLVFTDYRQPPAPTFTIFANTEFLPRVRFVPKIVLVKDKDEAAKILAETEFEAGTSAVVEGEISELEDVSTEAKISKTNFSEQKIKLTYESPTKNYLLLADTFYPGWKAFVDGKELKIFPANLNSKLALVPEGTHQVEFVYKPKSFGVGKSISIVSLLIWGGVFFKFGRKPKLKFLISN